MILYCWENKKSWITALVLVSLIAFLTPLNTVFSLFTNPNYTRWAYALALFLTLASVKWMDAHCEEKHISYNFLWGIASWLWQSLPFLYCEVMDFTQR